MTWVRPTTIFGTWLATALVVAYCRGEAAEIDTEIYWDTLYLLQQFQAPDIGIETDSIKSALRNQMQKHREQLQMDQEFMGMERQGLDKNKYQMEGDTRQVQANMQQLSDEQQIIKILTEENTNLHKQTVQQDDPLKVQNDFMNKEEETAGVMARYGRENSWLRQKVIEDNDVQKHLAKVNQDLREKVAQIPKDVQQLDGPLMTQKNIANKEVGTARVLVRYSQENSWLRQKVIEDKGVQKHLAKVNNELRDKIAQMSKDAKQLGASKTELEQTRETIVQLSHLLDDKQSLPDELVVKQTEEVANLGRKLEQERLENQKTKDVMGATIKNLYTIVQDTSMKLAAERKAHQMTKDQLSNIATRLNEENLQIQAAVKSA